MYAEVEKGMRILLNCREAMLSIHKTDRGLIKSQEYDSIGKLETKLLDLSTKSDVCDGIVYFSVIESKGHSIMR